MYRNTRLPRSPSPAAEVLNFFVLHVRACPTTSRELACATPPPLLLLLRLERIEAALSVAAQRRLPIIAPLDPVRVRQDVAVKDLLRERERAARVRDIDDGADVRLDGLSMHERQRLQG